MASAARWAGGDRDSARDRRVCCRRRRARVVSPRCAAAAVRQSQSLVDEGAGGGSGGKRAGSSRETGKAVAGLPAARSLVEGARAGEARTRGARCVGAEARGGHRGQRGCRRAGRRRARRRRRGSCSLFLPLGRTLMSRRRTCVARRCGEGAPWARAEDGGGARVVARDARVDRS